MKLRINFMIAPDQLNAVRAIAASRGTSYSDVIRAAISEYVLKVATNNAVDAEPDDLEEDSGF